MIRGGISMMALRCACFLRTWNEKDQEADYDERPSNQAGEVFLAFLFFLGFGGECKAASLYFVS